MMIPFRDRGIARKIGSGPLPAAARTLNLKDRIMKWETPEAVDFRFGMEITMYVANR